MLLDPGIGAFQRLAVLLQPTVPLSAFTASAITVSAITVSATLTNLSASA
jgi:hypothetical protein